MSLPPDYSIRRNGNSYEVWHSHYGCVLKECYSYGSAEDHAHEHAAEREEMAKHDLSEGLADAVADFLKDLERFEVLRHLTIGVAEDRAEIASLQSLRSAHAAAVASVRKAA